MVNAKNLLNQRFGKLIVIARAENTRKGNTQWLCRCDCGNEKIALGYDLTHGRTVSCGCNLKGTTSPKRIDLTGQRFGKLTVESLASSENGILIWKCKCDCGNEKLIRGGNLKSKKGLSCGCDKYGKKVVDITGNKYGRLTVISRGTITQRGWSWNCLCECGNEVMVNGDDLKANHTKSCGCLAEENRHRSTNLKHGDTRKQSPYFRLYNEWTSMLNRCRPTYHLKHRYYDRGITVCEEWKNYLSFKKWALQNGYKDNLTLDRKNNDGNYEPSNCRWATQKEQANNTSKNIYITYKGKTQTMKQWCEELDLSYTTIKARHQRGITAPQLFSPSYS